MEQYRIKLVSSAEKVFPAKEPTGAGMKDSITALKDETISFQIAYYWGGPWKSTGQVRVNAPDDLNVRVRLVKLVPCAYPCHTARDDQYLSTEPGMYPDLLSCLSIRRELPVAGPVGDVTEVGFPLVGGQWRAEGSSAGTLMAQAPNTLHSFTHFWIPYFRNLKSWASKSAAISIFPMNRIRNRWRATVQHVR